MNNPDKALIPFEEAYAIRKKLLEPTDGMIASSLNNIALAYTEMGELDKAYAAHEEAISIRHCTNSNRIGNSYSNLSSLLLRMNRPDEAEEMLKRCPSLKDFTDETFIKTGNPRFSGDMVLLSRIRVQQGRLDEALRLASKALVFRQRLLGNRLKTCDSLYDVASLLHKHGNAASAIELLGQLIDIASSIPEGKGQLARAYFKLAVLQEERGRHGESHTCKEMAESLMAELKPEAGGAPLVEEEFMKLSSIDFQFEPGDKEMEPPHKQPVMPQEEEHKSNGCEVAQQAIKKANEIRDSAHKLKADQEKMWERLATFDRELEKLKKKLISSEQSKPAVGKTSRKRKAKVRPCVARHPVCRDK
ncbi:TPR-like protein [Periconia macrospinosa]|uniref:TPR-like protein n=1 Tax=Periconia macrospinosa TaxID=97972 RepID=A0A2V1D3B4_9PLEO|nr:TPR-like protein [Periconia macrospinosa]